ncbi:uncharacterized protein BT62DRAFT_932850 [Guyanagaster necrorhizus]|uniref:Uncharacterized protein n=1 Tax=Guyanagaster necrorhizus TaxID=856835 RepID=A0A9P7VS41_9AGAR|nr:uncharacterized protein BT62DRAFT_932850 [Guyanagaster necrorhizus MCA 3950]KAG7445690.1 hypothetical protein BT62DRAFT_932850 [Guyanagaster necrorhizus MCA 3950]
MVHKGSNDSFLDAQEGSMMLRRAEGHFHVSAFSCGCGAQFSSLTSALFRGRQVLGVSSTR